MTAPDTALTPVGPVFLVDRLPALHAQLMAAAARRLSFGRDGARSVHEFFQTLDPYGPALFPVNWAGEDHSTNWFDIGREYTERWLHQQQIREAVGAPGLSGREWLHPTLDIFVRALPFTYRNVGAPAGRSVRFEIAGPRVGSGPWSGPQRVGPCSWAPTRVRLPK